MFQISSGLGQKPTLFLQVNTTCTTDLKPFTTHEEAAYLKEELEKLVIKNNFSKLLRELKKIGVPEAKIPMVAKAWRFCKNIH